MKLIGYKLLKELPTISVGSMFTYYGIAKVDVEGVKEFAYVIDGTAYWPRFTEPAIKNSPDWFEAIFEQEFKVGDWVTVKGPTNNFSSTYENQTYIVLEPSSYCINDPRLINIATGHNTDGGFNIDKNQIRAATPEEMIKRVHILPKIQINGYTVKKSGNGVYFGCQSFTKEELEFTKRLLNIKGNIKIYDTFITKEMIDSILQCL